MGSPQTGALIATTLLLTACAGGPTLDDARDFLQEGDPESALAAARGAAGRSPIRKERITLRRVAFRASLTAGWSHEAAREYLEIRRITGHEDPMLLTELSRATLGMALRCADGGRRLSALSTLTAIGDQERVRARIMASLSDPRGDVRAAATSAVATLPSATEALSGLEKAATDPSPRVRLSAFDALAHEFSARLRPRSDSEVDAGILDRLVSLALAGAKDPSAQVRLSGVDLLATLGDDARARDGLVVAVSNGSDSVCLRAAARLLALDPKLAYAAWTQAEPSGRTLKAFGRSLALHVGKGSHAAVERDLRSRVYARRLASVRGLAGPAAQHTARTLRRLLTKDPATTIRLAALRALVVAGSPHARRALATARTQESPAVRHLAFTLAQRPFTLPELETAFADRATSLDAARGLLARFDAKGRSVVRAGLGHVETREIAALALAERGDPGLHRLYIDLLEDDDPRIRSCGALGLVSTGLPEDRILLVQAMLSPERDADVVAAAALLAIRARTAPEATTSLSVQ